jgi:hypothetical protein
LALRRFYQAGHPTDQETAKCPEPLCPTLVLPPLGRRNFHLLRGHYPSVLALTSSCATPLGSLILQHLASFEESLQVVPSPCCPRELPDVISENLSLDAGSRTTAVPPSALTCFFPGVIGLPPAKMGSASRFDPRITTSRGPVFSRLQIFLNVPASKFAHPPDRPYRCAYCHRAAGAFTSGHIVLRYLRTHRIC